MGRIRGRALTPEKLLASPLAYNLVLEGELLAIVRELEAANIGCMVLKGVPLTHRLHGRLDARVMVDNDLLVHRSDVLKAARCLGALGYKHVSFHTAEGDLRSDFQSAMFKPTVSGATVRAELHWSAFPPRMYSVPEALQWARTENLAFKGQTLRVFDAPMTLVHLASHFAQHRCTHPRILEDIAAAWNRWHSDIDIADLNALTESTGVRPALVYTLSAVHELGWLKADPPPLHSRRAKLLETLLPTDRLLASEASHYARTLLTAFLLDPRRVPGWLLADVAPPIDRMAAIYQTEVSKRLYLRYPTRPFRALRRLFKGTTTRHMR